MTADTAFYRGPCTRCAYTNRQIDHCNCEGGCFPVWTTSETVMEIRDNVIVPGRYARADAGRPAFTPAAQVALWRLQAARGRAGWGLLMLMISAFGFGLILSSPPGALPLWFRCAAGFLCGVLMHVGGMAVAGLAGAVKALEQARLDAERTRGW